MDLHEGFGYAFVYRCNKHCITSEIALYPRRNRDPSNACSDVIPPFNLDPEKIKAQVLHYGPEIPEGAWSKPCRPPGFCGYRGMASDFRFCKPDSAVMSRMMRRKYKQVIYKHVRTRYKQYIKDARNVSELMYWRAKLDSLPRDSAKSRYKRICMITGRTRSVSRVIGLTRHQFREFANRCLIPGIRRANW
ncbi:ribosomal protein S14p/S29e domain containing protein, putative [Babesia bigemina]|uniref:Ribosomal protein S14p/S29e domain containing protein, putative n=1 Tax=Babesia bigemina TaxID=5866 RepID=A0A061D680_BABBI|nr:ribosomal protein S14p/S29e domain containing protein, putative [Babesia bigemina]CDR96201.1 ribosomal protein S14p/S29e domain containing protein, putative [Babesia bigemina]|eukprot:XP_012768387.1 ribosomal protein S14p/S29e domain containing protein, putative [Babesia bigemina]